MADEVVALTDQQQSILVVDDDPGMCETLADILEAKGFVVQTALDGPSAIERMKADPFDLILIDVMMPGMNGVETLREIKSLRPEAMTVIMTGRSQLEGLVSEALWTGVDGVLYKPFDVDAVIDMVKRGSEQHAGTPTIDVKGYDIDPQVMELVPEEMARRYVLLPLEIQDGHLLVAMSDPTNLYAIEDLRVRTSMGIKPLRVSPVDIEAALDIHYRSPSEIEREIERIEPLASETEIQTAQRLTAELVAQTPIARAVELTIRQAVRDRASDVHVEPQETHVRIRYRIDGVLHDTMSLPRRVHAPMLSRIKVLSNLNIAERRRPQDGQFSLDVGDRTVDIRVATINTVHGEMAVLRILDKSVSVRGLDELGFLSDVQKRYERIIHAPWGVLLVAGPTGSGKTSTLYASINQLDRDEKKIITIEDPAEFRFGKISQVQVNRQANITFSSGLRAAMRLDPDIILVGEIRDGETARTAVQASLTGHLVLSTIHANDTVGAILRLVDLGIEPFLVTSSLLGVVSQRLVRRICKQCAVMQEIPSGERQAYERVLGEKRAQFLVGSGCNACAGTGYSGRVALFELLTMSDDIRRMVLRNANSDEIREKAIESGMRPMLKEGMLKVKDGITTPSEILKNVFALLH